MLINCFAVGLGGFIGAIGRYLIGMFPGYYYLEFPAGTMLINMIGAFCIGLIAGAIPLDVLTVRQQLLLKTGFCGGFTTFSTFSLEAFNLMEQGHWIMAGSYILLSVVLCLLGVFIGKWLAIQMFA